MRPDFSVQPVDPVSKKEIKVALAAGAVAGLAALVADVAVLDFSAHIEAAVAVATGAAMITGDDTLPGALLAVVGNMTLGVIDAADRAHRHDVGLIARAVVELGAEAVVEAAEERAEQQRQLEALAVLWREGAQTVAAREEVRRLLPVRLKPLQLRMEGQRVIARREARLAAMPVRAKALQLRSEGEALIAARQAKVEALPRMRRMLRMRSRSALTLQDFHELDLLTVPGPPEGEVREVGGWLFFYQPDNVY